MTSKEYHIAIGDVEFGSEEQEDVSIKDQSSILEVICQILFFILITYATLML